MKRYLLAAVFIAASPAYGAPAAPHVFKQLELPMSLRKMPEGWDLIPVPLDGPYGKPAVERDTGRLVPNDVNQKEK